MKNLAFISLSIILYTFTSCKKDYTSLNNTLSHEVISGASGTTSSLKYGKMTDIEGNAYKTIQIGTQIWMAENLNVSKFRNGDAIANIKSDLDWVSASVPGWCFLNNSPGNGATYGKLYNWLAVVDPRGLAPIGWHIPSKTEWEQLINYLGGVEVAGKKMKSTSGWVYGGKSSSDGANSNGTNESGFTALPSGYRNEYLNGLFYPRNCGNWWSSTENFESNSLMYRYYFCYILSFYEKTFLAEYPQISGFSVRCVKD